MKDNLQIAVLGAGLMGQAAVYQLTRLPDVSRVIVADRDDRRAALVASTYGHDRTQSAAIEIADGYDLRALLLDCDVAIGAASYRFNVEIMQACIDTATHFCDLGGNHRVVETQFHLSPAAREAGIAVVPDCGLAPGLVSILTARLLDLMPSADTVHIRVGGLPKYPRPPFNYSVVFSVEGLVNEYREPSLALRQGEVVELETLGDLEAISFPPPFEHLEAFNTSGGASTLPHTLKGRIANLDYQTIRYPGHCDLIRGLFALGLAEEQPEVIDGTRVVPRRILEHHLAKTLVSSGPDVVLVLVEALGPEGRKAFRIIDEADSGSGLSAMMRCTAFPAAIIAHMLGRGEIAERGTLHQEFSIPTQMFLDRLQETGITLIEE